MRVLHVCKTSDGAFWAVRQVSELVREGVDVHVALPSELGAAVPAWRTTGARLHFVDCGLPTNPARLIARLGRIRRLVGELSPDLIHSHFVSTTIMLRLALGRSHKTPRLFQVPGPLHLEHHHTRVLEKSLAGQNDFWIGSSKCILRLYEAAGVTRDRTFLSYYSAAKDLFSSQKRGYLRERLNIPTNSFVVGNINLIYPPKSYLGHKVGLKCHEDVIHAIALVQRNRPNVWGVLIGGTFGKNQRYETKLRELAKRMGSGKILMPGKFNACDVAQSWPDFDCAVHVPFSENCGGVVEPLLCGIPTIASAVGGLPEVVHPGETGELVPVHRPDVLARAIVDVIDNYNGYCSLAMKGSRLTSEMFDPKRCAREILNIYDHVLHGKPRPSEFAPTAYLASMREKSRQGDAEVFTSKAMLAVR